MYLLNDSKNFYFIFAYQKYVEFYGDFKCVEITAKRRKVHPEKVIFQKRLQVSSKEEDKLQFLTLFSLKLFC